MPMRFLKPVELPKRCMLNEVLLWVAFRRVPVAMRSPEEETEVRDAEEDMFAYKGYGGYAGYTGDLSDSESFLDDAECAALNLPPDPRTTYVKEEEKWATDNWEDEQESQPDMLEWRPNYEQEDLDTWFERVMQAWMPKYLSAIEYPATRIYMALREGKLTASGKLLPDLDRDKALESLETVDQRICDLETLGIPPTFWSFRGIDWWSNAARSDHEHYCWIRCRTEDLLKAFPAEDGVPLSGAEKIGDDLVLHEDSQKPLQAARPRGRPPFDWDAFHLEVTDLLMKGTLPKKKEAAISYFQDWFNRAAKQDPKRTAIGDKLKPYYDRFVKSSDGN